MHTSLDSIVYLSINWSINSLFVDFVFPKLTLGKYDVAVLQRAISILRIILLAGSWVMEVAVLCRDNIK